MEKKEYKIPLITIVVLKNELLESPVISISGTTTPEESDSKEFTFDEDFSTNWEEKELLLSGKT